MYLIKWFLESSSRCKPVISTKSKYHPFIFKRNPRSSSSGDEDIEETKTKNDVNDGKDTQSDVKKTKTKSDDNHEIDTKSDTNNEKDAKSDVNDDKAETSKDIKDDRMETRDEKPSYKYSANQNPTPKKPVESFAENGKFSTDHNKAIDQKENRPNQNQTTVANSNQASLATNVNNATIATTAAPEPPAPPPPPGSTDGGVMVRGRGKESCGPYVGSACSDYVDTSKLYYYATHNSTTLDSRLASPMERLRSRLTNGKISMKLSGSWPPKVISIEPYPEAPKTMKKLCFYR